MAKLRIFSGKELCDLLSRRGFSEIRRKGSHIVMQRRDEYSTTTVIVPDHDEL